MTTATKTMQNTGNITIKHLIGADIHPYIEDLARLRITVFREYPYLYDGSHSYEERYLQTYADSDRSFMAVVFDNDMIVGASTAIPMVDEMQEIKTPLLGQGYDIKSMLYLGESILLPEYRGRGIGHRFFDDREKYAHSLELTTTAFCAIVRPSNHPRRPDDFTPLDPFWEKRGYHISPDLTTTLTWKDIDEEEEHPKPMQFWIKQL